MTKEELLKELADVMHMDEALNEDMILDDIDEWDSLAFVSIMVFFKNTLNIQIDAQALKQCEKVSDLLALAKI
ncbi:acyl carrier protein [Campylobacter insulaenigrae]|uniref:Acyl carrier protein n=1 Tax=Campylobacter insulaenigrae TaxID=260714 RepID=A0ABY3G6G8_9BACT|nr:acyl carrier protein [Campylobacter insulaenigrae]MCR6570883.1 acyl carrier protein [Campylobacter insulaenigrae]MCR6572458.1 acyl carrier protein [Campylobacter insulaenigrae]MCR6574095.1 acyl carrier protein [Campylobacter insulaenigrae]MCR6575149.1 acyl carrier protein [Campylobacter insulaenigrae]MCR6577148.1 acyl carrier protein [Campylobacter insulaenigrae]